jgi:hypothetical protein
MTVKQWEKFQTVITKEPFAGFKTIYHSQTQKFPLIQQIRSKTPHPKLK